MRTGESDATSLDQATRDFAAARPRLFGIAYRMLGSATEAEDVVQEVWLRWQKADRSDILEPAAFLATVATRLAINVTQSARVRRESYVGPWLPEPVDTSMDPQMGRGAGRGAGDGGPLPAGEAEPDGAGRVRPAGSLRLSVQGGRGHPSDE